MSSSKDNSLPVREEEEMMNMDHEDDDEEDEEEEMMDPNTAAQHHLYQMQAMQQAGYPMPTHGEMDPNTAAAYGVHPGYSGMDYSAAAAYGVDYQMQQLYYQQSMQRFLSSLPPSQQQQYLAQMQQQQRNPQMMKAYATSAATQQKYSTASTPSGYVASSSVDPSVAPPSPENSSLTPEDGGKKKRGRKNNADGEGKKGEKARQRAVRHNWTQAQDDALKKAINSQQYSENGQKIRWTKISQEKKEAASEDAVEGEDGKKKKSKKKATTTKKKKKKKGEEESEPEEEESAKRKKLEDDSSTRGKNYSRRKSANPRKGNVSVIFSSETVSVKQESDVSIDPILGAASSIEHTETALFGEKKRPKVYLSRKVPKKNRNAKYINVDDVMNHIYETNPQEKYVSISIKSADIFRNFQPIPNHPLKVDCLLGLYFGTNERNICLSSYRTMVENEQFGQLDVSFPTNLVSFFSKCRLRRNTKNSLFLCVALRQAALVQSLDDDPSSQTIPLYWDKHNYGATVFSSHAFVGFFSGQYPVQLRTATGILLQSPLTINVKFSDSTDKLSDYPLELSKVHYREVSNQSNLASTSNTQINPLILGSETLDQKDDILQLHYMVYKVNYINTHNRGVERLWLRWDMNCPLEDDFEVNNMMIMGTNTDEDTFAQLKKHLTEKHGDRFEIQFEGREGEGETGSYIISMNQYKHWYQNYQYMDRKRLMLLDPSTMDVNQLTHIQKQFMDVWNSYLLENFKLLMTENEAHDACRNLYINERSKLDADEMKEILAHQFLRLTSLNVISIEHFMNLLGEAKIPLTSALEQQLQHIQQMQQIQQQTINQNMQYAQMVNQLSDQQPEEEEEDEEDE
ncbi:predicted protein [Naegleria gruberi]|uniref:Predicted protein n=1 Tax=Naegleria gruberi TaxID=5762 RepID=D2V9C4_NAEGR|nr:uncharacterized protein NAEGRDRAFT_79057 [Naegleria gruberi]EFC46434.1 predicted protein [Naegleria gruberi]|eukprot:XP_002679178.1 predicted protein [Naegleria gruberi strain NEG-M]